MVYLFFSAFDSAENYEKHRAKGTDAQGDKVQGVLNKSFNAVHKVAAENKYKQSNTNGGYGRHKHCTCGDILDFADMGILLGGVKVAGFLNSGVDKLCYKNRTYGKNKNCPLGYGDFTYVSKQKYKECGNKVKTHVAFGNKSSGDSLESIFEASKLSFHVLLLVYCVAGGCR